jgi:hypothetical protein
MIEEPFLREQPGADALEEGFYLIRRRARAQRVDVPVRIWFGPPLDPETREPLERSWRWQIELAGYPFDEVLVIGGITFAAVSDFWPVVKREPIDEAEYRFRLQRQEWAAEFDEYDPFGTPGGRIDPMTATLPFGD